MSIIYERRSIRKYKQGGVSDEQIKELLRAGMSSPTACNAQEWEFIVIKSRETLDKIVEIHPYARAVKHDVVCILVCGNMDKEIAKNYWEQDTGAAIQTILLRATEIGLGSLWMGVYPNEPVRNQFIKLFNLPDNIKPVGLIAIGIADEKKEPEDRYDEAKVHYEVYRS